MQAIMLAAGMGKRLGDLTAHATKCMVRVNGVSLIERALRQLDALKLEQIILVVGYQAKSLVDFVGTLQIHTPIIFVENPHYETTNNIYSLFLARSYLLEQDTLLLESDLIFEPAVLHALVEDPFPTLALVAKYESWMDGTVVTVDSDHRITEFLNKKQFKFDDSGSYYKTVNIYKFSKEFSRSHYVPFLEAYCKALGNNEYYEQVLKVIALLDDPGIRAKILENERWYEIDDKQDLDIAESLFTEHIEQRYKKISQRFGGYWRYPKLLDFCYLVNPYFPPERLVDEIKANADRLIRDYPSGQQVNALLAAKYFNVDQEMVVVGNGAAELIKALLEGIDGNVGILRPTFDEYPNRLEAGREVTFIPSGNNGSYGAKEIMQHFDDTGISSLILINPDNPTGNILSKEEVLDLVDWSAKKNILLVVDESFIDFSDPGTAASILSRHLLAQNKHVIIVKSISKSYGVPGLRLGMLFSGDVELVGRLKKDVAIWNINSFAEFFMQIWEKYRNDYIVALEHFRSVRTTFLKDLQRFPWLEPIPSQANYLLCRVHEPYTSTRVAHLLLEQNILIKDLKEKIGLEGSFIRIAIRREEENAVLIKALENLAYTES